MDSPYDEEGETHYRRSRLDTDSEGNVMFVLAYGWTRYVVAEINAYTGELIERGVIDDSVVGIDEAFYGDIGEHFFPWPMDS